MAQRKLLVIQAAALGAGLLEARGITKIAGMPVQSMRPAFPAVTCTSQAALRTGTPCETNGMLANGLYFPDTAQSLFWCQSAALVRGPRFWDAYRAAGGRVGMYFFQQSLGESVDEIVSPAPIHKHGGGMILSLYQQPRNLLRWDAAVPLWRYWGPLASPKVGRGIVRNLAERILRDDAPGLMMVYLPTLDYQLQRYGNASPKTDRSFTEFLSQVRMLADTARSKRYGVVLSGDYAIEDVLPQERHPVAFPNRLLVEAGLFRTREVAGMRYPDLFSSRAVALCDHQCATVYCADLDAMASAKACLSALPQVESLSEVPTAFAGASQHAPNRCAFSLLAKHGCWFAYPWWALPKEAPDFATHVDIHSKPGFDPCELFFGRTPMTCSTDPTRIRGTHGHADLPVVFCTDTGISAESTEALGAAIAAYLAK